MNGKLSVTIFLPDDQAKTIYISPELVYERARHILPELLHIDAGDQQGTMIRSRVKGFFKMSGDSILDKIFGGKDHPRPSKGDDLVVWYLDLFTQLLIVQLMKHDMLLEGRETIEGIEISGFAPESIPAST